ncbi:predicted protein [Sclerotinia sclerotiorum 1980 UF-70]|uniref:Uncharacterized protein n=1 Tax=Sclerotinia sclerotiorum (strain ATCC 18683 / 1980 / Ss-1) TaxID=665079 RepID=A7EJ45_SCLS1|nr:predicted protein [Sclerotinia sclerotiorum 1980 UF-70]EDO02861.1 predicted protein [Sclerotinia sclerotiorum 1980 UF-70]
MSLEVVRCETKDPDRGTFGVSGDTGSGFQVLGSWWYFLREWVMAYEGMNYGVWFRLGVFEEE